MNPVARLCSGLLLALVLAATSVSMAVARQQAAAGMTVVICTSVGLETITLDADGNPVGPVHLCPLCLAAADLPPGTVLGAVGESRLIGVMQPPPGAFTGFSRAFCDLRARAPPVSGFA
ncbi:DUF2946 family protein [Roseicitreum antarcticum]|nr:DUF2946 family protein [Roseicitreum antarcticum]